jgi:hypothetical protein
VRHARLRADLARDRRQAATATLEELRERKLRGGCCTPARVDHKEHTAVGICGTMVNGTYNGARERVRTRGEC